MKKLLSLLIVTIFCISVLCMPASAADITNKIYASGTCGANLVWTLYVNGTLEISGTGDMTEWNDYLAVPWWRMSRYGDLPIQSVVIENGVTSIGELSFYYLDSITSVTMSNSITKISRQAFAGCTGLTSIKLSDNLTSLGYQTFDHCTNLSNITIGDKLTSIGNNAFLNTAYYNNSDNWEEGVLYLGRYLIDTKKEVSGSYEIKPGTLGVGDYAVDGCKLTRITLPDGLKFIGDVAFSGNRQLSYISLPDSIETIGGAAFFYVSQKTAYYRGTPEQWKNVSVGTSNDALLSGVFFVKHTKTAVSDDTFTVTPVNIDNGTRIILALYSGNDFVETQSAIYAGEALTFTTDKAYTSAKVMAWDAALAPVCEAENVKLN